MTNGDYPCGHNHDPNPHVDPERARAFSMITRSLFRVACVTCVPDPAMTTVNAACAGLALTAGGDRIEGFRALMWEVGALLNQMTHGVEPELAVLGDDDKDTDSTDDSDGLAKLGSDALSAFFAAASVGEFPAAVRVLDALVTEANAKDWDPDVVVAQFFGNALTSMGYTVRHRAGEGNLPLFED